VAAGLPVFLKANREQGQCQQAGLAGAYFLTGRFAGFIADLAGRVLKLK